MTSASLDYYWFVHGFRWWSHEHTFHMLWVLVWLTQVQCEISTSVHKRGSGLPTTRKASAYQFRLVQFSPLTDSVVGGTLGTIQWKSSSSLFCRRPFWAVLAWAGMSTFWCYPSSTSCADQGVAELPRCPEGYHASFRLLTVARGTS